MGQSSAPEVGGRGAPLPLPTGVFSQDELEEAIQVAAAQAVDSDAGTRVTIPQRRLNSKTTVQGAEEDQPGGDRQEKSADAVRKELDAADGRVHDAIIQSLEVAVTDGSIEEGDESGARRLLLAERCVCADAVTVAALVDDGVQRALRGYAARCAREEHELDLLRVRAAGIALGSGGVDGIDTGADGVITKSSTGGQKGRGAAKRSGKPGHTRTLQATAGES